MRAVHTAGRAVRPEIWAVQSGRAAVAPAKWAVPAGTRTAHAAAPTAQISGRTARPTAAEERRPTGAVSVQPPTAPVRLSAAPVRSAQAYVPAEIAGVA